MLYVVCVSILLSHVTVCVTDCHTATTADRWNTNSTSKNANRPIYSVTIQISYALLVEGRDNPTQTIRAHTKERDEIIKGNVPSAGVKKLQSSDAVGSLKLNTNVVNSSFKGL